MVKIKRPRNKIINNQGNNPMFTNHSVSKTSLACALALPLLLSSCGGSDSNSDSVNFSLAVSDAPVDGLDSVYICFSDIELKGNGSDDYPTTFNPSADLVGTLLGDEVITACIDDDGFEVSDSVLLKLSDVTGSDSINFIGDEQIALGNYSQMRLTMLPYSYATKGEDTFPVRVPSNELKLDGFTATQGNNVSYTIEFDFRQGMTDPEGQEGYILKPRGVRLVDNNAAGHIGGTVNELLLTVDNGCESPANSWVYLYEGQGYALTELSDMGATDGIVPLTSVAVSSTVENQGPYSYEIGFVSVNEAGYTLALTCSEDLDPEMADTDFSVFQAVETVVIEGETADASFSLL